MMPGCWKVNGESMGMDGVMGWDCSRKQRSEQKANANRLLVVL